MKKESVLLLLDELLEVPAGTLKGDESTQAWDSITIICVMALADEKFSRSISGTKIKGADTVNDVVSLLID